MFHCTLVSIVRAPNFQTESWARPIPVPRNQPCLHPQLSLLCFPLLLVTCHPHLLCLLQRTRPCPCSRACATGRWGPASVPCLWPRGSPSRYAAAAEWAKHGAASVRNALCLAQVTLCFPLSSGHQGASSKPGAISPHLSLTLSQKTLVFLLAQFLNPAWDPSLLAASVALSFKGREGVTLGSCRNSTSQRVL